MDNCLVWSPRYVDSMAAGWARRRAGRWVDVHSSCYGSGDAHPRNVESRAAGCFIAWTQEGVRVGFCQLQVEGSESLLLSACWSLTGSAPGLGGLSVGSGDRAGAAAVRGRSHCCV